MNSWRIAGRLAAVVASQTLLLVGLMNVAAAQEVPSAQEIIAAAPVVTSEGEHRGRVWVEGHYVHELRNLLKPGGQDVRIDFEMAYDPDGDSEQFVLILRDPDDGTPMLYFNGRKALAYDATQGQVTLYEMAGVSWGFRCHAFRKPDGSLGGRILLGLPREDGPPRADGSAENRATPKFRLDICSFVERPSSSRLRTRTNTHAILWR
jgi:hypothetical protein